MTIKLAIVVGNPKPRSRTLLVAETLAKMMFAGTVESRVIDLADHSAEVLSWPNDDMQELTDSVAASDVVIVASPTYKATYTGLLKSFLDRFPANGLQGVTAIPLMTGGSPDHSMGPTVNLAPLLMELGAVVPGRGMYFVMEHMDRLDEVVRAEANRYSANLRQTEKCSADLVEGAIHVNR